MANVELLELGLEFVGEGLGGGGWDEGLLVTGKLITSFFFVKKSLIKLKALHC